MEQEQKVKDLCDEYIKKKVLALVMFDRFRRDNERSCLEQGNSSRNELEKAK